MPKTKVWVRLVVFFVFAFFIFNAIIQTKVPDIALIQTNQENSIQIAKTEISVVPIAHGDWRTELNIAVDWITSRPKAIATGAINEIAAGFLWVINWMLYIIICFENLFLQMSVSLFDNVIEESFFKGMLVDNPGVYMGWSVVRDFLNLFFMMALLFSAFATIFQVDKYHLKKITVMLVVMALLVNFSYPISLFIIDFFNSIMFYIADAVFGNTAHPSIKFAQITSMGEFFKQIFEQESVEANDKTLMLLLGVVFMFMMTVTVAAFAFNLFVRTIALTLLVIFSPVGFTLSFFPTSKGMADQWWDALIKYCMMGPVLMLVLMCTFLIFNGSLGEIAKPEDSGGIIKSMAVMLLPIITLWLGLAASQKYGATFSGNAMSIIKNTGNKVQGWAKSGVVGAAVRTDAALARTTGVSVGGVRKAWKDYGARKEEGRKSDFAKSARNFEGVIESGMELVTPFTRVSQMTKGFKGGVAAEESRINKKYDEKIAAAPQDKALFDSQRAAELNRLKATSGLQRDARYKGLAKGLFTDPTSKARSDRRYLEGVARAEEASKKMDTAGAGDTSYVMGQLKSALDVKDSEKAHAAILSLTRSGDLAALMQSDLAKNLGLGDGTVDTDNLGDLLKGVYAEAGIKDEETIGKNMNRIKDLGSKNNNLGYGNLAGYDSNKKSIVPKTRQERIAAAPAAFKSREAQQRQRLLRSESLFKYSNNDDAVFSDMGLAILGAVSRDDLTHLDKLNGDVKERLSKIVTAYDKRGGVAHDAATLAALSPEDRKNAERENKLIEQYNSMDDIAKKYVRMAHHMKLGLDAKGARNKVEQEVSRVSQTATTGSTP